MHETTIAFVHLTVRQQIDDRLLLLIHEKHIAYNVIKVFELTLSLERTFGRQALAIGGGCLVRPVEIHDTVATERHTQIKLVYIARQATDEYLRAFQALSASLQTKYALCASTH